GDYRDAVNGESHTALGGRKGVGENGLFAGLQAASTGTLQHAADNERGQVGCKSAQEGTHGKQGYATHVEVLAADDGGEPAAQGKHDGVGDEIGSEDPGAFILPGREAACDVRQCHVGDGSVEDFHESRQRDCDGDDPGIDGR